MEGATEWQSLGPEGRLPEPPNDETGHTWHHGNATLFDYARRGGPAVLDDRGGRFNSTIPAFGDLLSDVEIKSILAFIRSTGRDRVRVAGGAHGGGKPARHRSRMWDRNDMVADASTTILSWLDRHFSVDLPFTRFARNILLLSLIGLAPVLALYIALTPGFWSHLIATDAALARFVRQIATNGLPVVAVVNASSLVLFARLRADLLRPSIVLAIDIPARIGGFLGLHAVIYPASALMFGSFGGDPFQALRVVGPTLARAAGFENLSGVYLYATLVGAIPLHMALAGVAARRHGNGNASLAVLSVAALALFGLQAAILTGSALLLGTPR